MCMLFWWYGGLIFLPLFWDSLGSFPILSSSFLCVCVYSCDITHTSLSCTKQITLLQERLKNPKNCKWESHITLDLRVCCCCCCCFSAACACFRVLLFLLFVFFLSCLFFSFVLLLFVLLFFTKWLFHSEWIRQYVHDIESCDFDQIRVDNL